jgi:hypothetical protein
MSLALRAAFGARPVGAQASSAFNVSGMTGPAPTALTVPTGVLNNQVTHPSVYFNPDGWNGWEYWLAITPYDGTTSAFENPCIFVSHDGDNWQAPAGLTNPLTPKPAVGYNSDPYLTLGPDGKLYCFYRPSDDVTYGAIVFKSSSDGVTWGSETECFRAGKSATLSPSVIWDGKQWVCYTVSNDPATTGTLDRRTSPTLAGTWSAPTPCTGLTLPTGREMWHVFVTRFLGRYYALVNDAGEAQTASQSAGNLYLASSPDGMASRGPSPRRRSFRIPARPLPPTTSRAWPRSSSTEHWPSTCGRARSPPPRGLPPPRPGSSPGPLCAASLRSPSRLSRWRQASVPPPRR